jgi:ABC-type multidrug transport system fused ATPase/permease subunit
VLSRSWENVTLGNSHNESIWRKREKVAGASFYAVSNRLQILKQGGNVLLAAASLGPTIFLIVSIVRDAQTSAATMAAIRVSLTRGFLILNSLSALVYKFLDWSSIRARLEVLFDTASSVSTNDGERQGVMDCVSLNGVPVDDVLQAVQVIRGASYGRFLITGANGSGKSTLLLALKSAFSGASFLLPAHHGDLMWDVETAHLSTGKKAEVCLREILALPNVKYLLLDKWDANLDNSNRQAINQMPDEMSQVRTIVEVCHEWSRQ